jgi:hypothetical protein
VDNFAVEPSRGFDRIQGVSDYSRLDDATLLQTARELAQAERELAARFLACLSEIDRRGLYRQRGHASLFDYCVKELGYAEPAAYRRIQAVRAGAKAPEVFSYVATGELSLEAVGRLAPLVIAEPSQACALLETAKNKPLREIERLAAARDPKAEPRDTARAKFLTQDRVHFSFSGSESLRSKLERLRDRLRHKFPHGRFEELIEDAVDARLAQLDPALKKPAAPRTPPDPSTRRVPRWVRDEVWKRDQGRCAWTGPSGRCGSTAWLEYDHVVPWALGGPSWDPKNIRLLCRAHNRQAAEERGLGRPS